jgi:hypothetical protein
MAAMNAMRAQRFAATNHASAAATVPGFPAKTPPLNSYMIYQI